VTRPARAPTATLFGQLLALIVLSLVAAQGISAFIVFQLPPPTPDFYRLSEIAQTFGPNPPSFTERRALKVVNRAEPPSPPLRGRYVPAIKANLAEALGVSEDDIKIGAEYRPPWTDRRTLRTIRARIIREGGGREEHFLIAPFEVGVRQADGSWRVVQPEPPGFFSPWRQRVALWFLLSALVMVPIAWLFARRLSRPISLFAEAADRLGRDPRAEPLPLKGSAEIRVAAKAFNDMQERLARYVDDRTAMVAAIAHDLRTPLTRLRFRIESVADAERGKMAADLDQMEEMIAATLSFVRDAGQRGERTPLELSSLVESLCDEMSETGSKCEVERSERVILNGDPLALRRLFSNLLENAVKFGGAARARVFREGPTIVVEIDDDGPGVPEEDLERVFDPFYRREPSRSRQTGGAGLGLAVVRSVARGHGGDVTLFNRAGGGLTARVMLPA